MGGCAVHTTGPIHKNAFVGMSHAMMKNQQGSTVVDGSTQKDMSGDVQVDVMR